MVGVERLALPRLFEFESNRSAIPDEPHADENGVPDRLCSRLRSEAAARQAGDLLRERQACWMDYTTGIEIVRAEGFAPLT